MIASGVRRIADQILTLFVPKLDQPARAVDCQQQKSCFRSHYWWYRTCCAHSNGTWSCGQWWESVNPC
jgi:hypothetical protein